MAIWVIPVIIAGAVVIGLIVGLIAGKSQVRRSRPGYKPLLSGKEKLIYTALALCGTALILVGVFYKFPNADVNGMGMGFDSPPIEIAMEKRG